MNTDVFRQVYTPASEEKKAEVLAFKKKAQELYDLLPNEGNYDLRMISLAKTNLEQAVMWAVKGMLI